jgi:hypothetical protein
MWLESSIDSLARSRFFLVGSASLVFLLRMGDISKSMWCVFSPQSSTDNRSTATRSLLTGVTINGPDHEHAATS